MLSRLSQFACRGPRRTSFAAGFFCLLATSGLGENNDPPTIQPVEIQPVVENYVDTSPMSAESAALPTEARARFAAEWVGYQAALRVPLGKLMRADLQADRSSLVKPTEKQQAVLQLRDRVQEFRIARQSQIAAAKAMEIHFGLATIEALQQLQVESLTSLNLHQQRQDRAVEKGVGILDRGP